jgi:AAA15 family ATPase/GTPase
MITKIRIESFKSIENAAIELGNLNVFIGANGSGKSNLLEAIGVLSAAADGKVTDQTLLQRGVRPGVLILPHYCTLGVKPL